MARQDNENFPVWSHDEIIKQQLEEYPILLYGKSPSDKFTEIKEELRKHEIQFEAFEMNHMSDGNEIQKILRQITKQKQIPYVFVGGTYWGTDKEFFDSVKNQELFKTLDRSKIYYKKEIS